jgi:hypothetical protein
VKSSRLDGAPPLNGRLDIGPGDELQMSQKTSLTERIAYLETVEAVRRLFFDYTWALDHADIDGIVAQFAVDGTFEFGGAAWTGHERIRSYFTEDRKSHTGMLHYPVNIVVDVDAPAGEAPRTAHGRATLLDLFNRVTPKGPQGMVLTGYYDLSARRVQDGSWKIARLEVLTTWIVPAGQAWSMLPNFESRPELRK